MSLEEKIADHPVLLFDGVCHLCEASVQFIIKRDPRGVFRFVPLQSPFGQELLKKFHLSQSDLNTMILIERDQYYIKSSAALHIARKLNGIWPLLSIFFILPRFIRDALYNFIAKNRYQWFGKKDVCMIPTPDIRGRFLE